MIYLASPYAHTSYQVRYLRYIQAVKFTAYLLDSGKHVYSPIAHHHAVHNFRQNTPAHYNSYKETDREMVTICDIFAILMLDGWKASVGVADEYEYAKELNKHCITYRYEMCLEAGY